MENNISLLFLTLPLCAMSFKLGWMSGKKDRSINYQDVLKSRDHYRNLNDKNQHTIQTLFRTIDVQKRTMEIMRSAGKQ